MKIPWGGTVCSGSATNTRQILVTTCLSAHSVGVHHDPHFVGTVGARVRRFVFINRKGNIDYKVNPPAYDWNSERISQCVSVEVRLTRDQLWWV